MERSRDGRMAYHDSDLPVHLAKMKFLEAEWVEAKRVVWATAGRRPQDGQLAVSVVGGSAPSVRLCAARVRRNGG